MFEEMYLDKIIEYAFFFIFQYAKEKREKEELKKSL